MNAEGGIIVNVKKNKEKIVLKPSLYLSRANPNLAFDWLKVFKSLGIGAKIVKDEKK